MWVCIDKVLIKRKLKSQNIKNRPNAKLAAFIYSFVHINSLASLIFETKLVFSVYYPD